MALIDYAPAFLARAADQLEAAPPELRQLVLDYSQFRRAVCAAGGWHGPVCERLVDAP